MSTPTCPLTGGKVQIPAFLGVFSSDFSFTLHTMLLSSSKIGESMAITHTHVSQNPNLTLGYGKFCPEQITEITSLTEENEKKKFAKKLIRLSREYKIP
jgi:hypothetical protein